MCDTSNLHTESQCSCANHNLPTYEEAVGAEIRNAESIEIHVTASKTETNHDRQPSAPPIEPARIESIYRAYQPSYPQNSYRTPSYNRTTYTSTGNTSSSAGGSRTRGGVSQRFDRLEPVEQKSDTPCQSNVAVAAFFVVLVFMILGVIMNYLHSRLAGD